MRKATHSTHITESFGAGQSAMKAINTVFSDSLPDFLFLFTTVGHDIGEVIRGIRSLGRDIPLCGCTGAGVITDSGCDEATHSVGLMGIAADNIRFAPFIFPDLSSDPEKIGENIAEVIASQGLSEEDRKLLFLFTDGLTVNADALFRGMNKALPYHVDIVGGTAGNDFQFDKTYQFCGDKVLNDAVSGVLIHGDFNYNIGVSHGSRPVGLYRKITGAEGNLILEIDNIPALDFLKSMMGKERVMDFGALNMFELGEPFGGQGYSEDILNRAIIGMDEERKAIRLAVELAEGTKIKITRRDMNLVLRKTREMAGDLTRSMVLPDDTAWFYFNCSGRGSYLFGTPEPDVDALRAELGPNREMIGFFTFGEFAPVGGQNHYHNYTGIFVGIE